MARASGWVPQQHGAWAMIVVPYVTGVLLASRVRALDLGDVLLGLTWLVGYFAFNATVLTLKSPPKRRPRLYPPLITYLSVAGALGVATLVAKGWEVLWWAPAYAVVLGWSLWLAAHKHERSLLSGVLTVVASCGLMAVLRLSPGIAPLTGHEAAVMVAVTLYFVGTVVHVKALIRERNDPTSATRSLIYHAVLAVAVGVCLALGWLSWPWLVWAVALVARSWWMPRTKLTPMQIGLVEIVASAALVALVALA